MERGDLTGAILDGRYRVIEPVAEGAMGVVYRAERVKLGRIVAIKVLHDVLPDELSGRKRFEIEAMAMAKLEHPHCASVLDVGVHGERPYVVMDFVSGQNLKEVIANGAQPIPRAIEIVRQVLSGLAHAHEHGIIHRDIKPANIVLSQKTGLGDHVKILDFGLARLHDTGQNLTTGIVVGTPAYMAPEQVRGAVLDHRVDLYACGVLLFELLTGRKPFHSEKDDPIEVCRMHLSEPIPRLDDMLPGVEFGELEAVIVKALAKRSDDRYASAEEYAAALDAAARRRVSFATLPPAPPSGPIRLASADVIGDVSYPPEVEVRSADVMSAISVDAPGSADLGPRPGGRNATAAAGAGRGGFATPAAGADGGGSGPGGRAGRGGLATPAAGVERKSAGPAGIGRGGLATPAAGVERKSAGPAGIGRGGLATPAAGVERKSAGPAGIGRGGLATPAAGVEGRGSESPPGAGAGGGGSDPGGGAGGGRLATPAAGVASRGSESPPGAGAGGGGSDPGGGAGGGRLATPAAGVASRGSESPPGAGAGGGGSDPGGGAGGGGSDPGGGAGRGGLATPAAGVAGTGSESAPGGVGRGGFAPPAAGVGRGGLATPAAAVDRGSEPAGGAGRGGSEPAGGARRGGFAPPAAGVERKGSEPGGGAGRGGLATPAAGVERKGLEPGGGAGRGGLATPAAGVARRGSESAPGLGRSKLATPAAGVARKGSEPIELLEPSRPGTFLGLPVTGPQPIVPREVQPLVGASAGDGGEPSMATAPRRPSRRRRIAVLAALGATLGAAAVALALTMTRTGTVSPGDPGAASGAPTPVAPTRELVSRANELVAQGEREAALELLNRSRKQYPDSAPLAYAAGRIYFAKYYWTDGLKSFRDALRADPAYRNDPELIKTVLRGFIMTPSYNDELAGFLRDDIGGAAQPFLEETARDHPNAAIRSRAANELRRYR